MIGPLELVANFSGLPVQPADIWGKISISVLGQVYGCRLLKRKTNNNSFLIRFY